MMAWFPGKFVGGKICCAQCRHFERLQLYAGACVGVCRTLQHLFVVKYGGVWMGNCGMGWVGCDGHGELCAVVVGLWGHGF